MKTLQHSRGKTGSGQSIACRPMHPGRHDWYFIPLLLPLFFSFILNTLRVTAMKMPGQNKTNGLP